MIHVAAGETAWTTRFGIVAKDGDTLVPEQEKTQSTGIYARSISVKVKSTHQWYIIWSL